MNQPSFLDDLSRAEIARNLESALENLGVDVSHADLKGTAGRVATLWSELFSGLQPENAPEFSKLSNADAGAGMVMARGIRFYSMCAHHLLPFFGRAHLAYLPAQKLAGLGDLARVVEYFSRRPTLQEHVASGIAEYLETGLAPRGVAVLLEGRHLCMEMRGDKRQAVVESAAYRGAFEDELHRREFLERLRRS